MYVDSGFLFLKKTHESICCACKLVPGNLERRQIDVPLPLPVSVSVKHAVLFLFAIYPLSVLLGCIFLWPNVDSSIELKSFPHEFHQVKERFSKRC